MKKDPNELLSDTMLKLKANIFEALVREDRKTAFYYIDVLVKYAESQNMAFNDMKVDNACLEDSLRSAKSHYERLLVDNRELETRVGMLRTELDALNAKHSHYSETMEAIADRRASILDMIRTVLGHSAKSARWAELPDLISERFLFLQQRTTDLADINAQLNLEVSNLNNSNGILQQKLEKIEQIIKDDQ